MNIKKYFKSLELYTFVLLATLFSPVSAANVNELSLAELKAAAEQGNAAAAAELVTKLLETVPRNSGNQPNSNLFAAQCWWEKNRTNIVFAVEAGEVGNRHFNYLNSIWQSYEETLMLTPGQLKRGESEYTFLDPQYQQQQIDRWGPGAADPDQLRHRVINETMPGLVFGQLNSMEDVDAAISRAEAFSGEHPNRPEPYAYLAELHLVKGNVATARESANRALDLFPGHYLAHYILANIEFSELGAAYACDSALVWQRLMQADDYNIQATLLVQPLIELYRAKPDLDRAKDIREQLQKRIDHDEMVIELAQQGRDLGERRWLSNEQFEQLRNFIAQLDTFIAAQE